MNVIVIKTNNKNHTDFPMLNVKLKFIYSEKATKFCEIFTLLLTTEHTVKSKVKISQHFVAFSEYMNFTRSCFVQAPYLLILQQGKNSLLFNFPTELCSCGGVIFSHIPSGHHSWLIHRPENIWLVLTNIIQKFL